MKILVTGATGLIGRALCGLLQTRGHHVVGLSRNPSKAENPPVAEMARWEPLKEPPPAEALDGAGAAVNLVGEPIADRRWSEEQKRRIVESRLTGTRNLVEGIRRSGSPPGVLVSGSAVGFYGDRGDEELDEDSPPGTGFLPELSQDWEAAARGAEESGVRVALIRTGVVLSTRGGALTRMLTPFKLGVGGPLGGGRQWFPWIHIDDIAGIFAHAIETSTVSGPLNGTAPEPVTNSDFTRALGAQLHRPAFLPAPAFGLKLAFGEMSEVLLGSQRVLPRKTLQSGYEFRFPSLRPALEDLLK